MSNPRGRPKISKEMSTHGFYNSGGFYKTRVDGRKTKECQLWENMRVRIDYLPLLDKTKYGKYIGVTVCEEWKDFQVFSAWFGSISYYENGWQLDKDLLFKGNTTYSPDTCVFLPEEVNKALNVVNRSRSPICLGISHHCQNSGMIDVRYHCKNPEFALRKYLKIEQVDYGFSLYKKAREGYIKHLAHKYKEDLDPRAYNALMSYSISKED